MKFWPFIKLLPDKTNLRFVKYAPIMGALSVIAVIASIFFTLSPLTPPCGGLNCGVDFSGGLVVEITAAPEAADIPAIRDGLNALDLRDVQVQAFGAPSEALIRFQTPEGDPGTVLRQVEAALTDVQSTIRVTRTEAVSGQVSQELLTNGVMALGVAMLMMLAYIWFRFQWTFGVGALIGLLHDVILTFGLFAITGMEFTLVSVAAILTIIGYSMNDTVVVCDRLRENLRKYKRMPLSEVIDLSLNETLSRTIMTGLTTILGLLAIALLGGAVLADFAWAMIFGVVIGTYSSIYIAAPLILLWGAKRGTEDEEDATPIKLGMASKP
jgi:preprotein translocase SecF subunit